MHNIPNPNAVFPIKDINTVIYIKPTIKNKNIVVGDFTYFGDVDFEKHVTHHYDFYDDKVIIGKFCQIAKGVEFVMNGATHQMDCVSTFPFYIFEGFKQQTPSIENFSFKGDTIVGNDVWIGQNVTIMSGVKIGNGAIIGANSTVTKDVEPYIVVGGNPAKFIKKRFDDDLIELLQNFKWWDLEIDEIQKCIPILTDNNIENARKFLTNKKFN